MTMLAEPDLPRATDGEIAAINLESARRRAWARFAQNPRLSGAAEAIVHHENLAAQFLSDLDALDRLEALASQFARADDSFRSALVQAEVASTVHRFAEARDHLACAAQMGAPREEIDRHLLSIDQACGVELDAVLAARQPNRQPERPARRSGAARRRACRSRAFRRGGRCLSAGAFSYDDVSPFPLAWACFQLGMLWGELVPVPDAEPCRALVSSGRLPTCRAM